MSNSIDNNIMERGSRKVQYLSTFAVAISSLCVGAMSSWVTPVLTKYHKNETNVEINDHEVAVMIALNSPGFMVGSLVTGYLADKLGRRKTLLASALPMVIGSVILVAALRAWLIYIARFLWGCGTGIVGTVVSMYIGEIADKDIRGTLMLITRVLFNLGNLFMMVVGPFISYNAINVFLLVLPICYYVTCWWIPESPHFYLRDGNIEHARKELKRLRDVRSSKVVEEELTTLQAQIGNEMRRSSNLWELLVGRAYRKALIVAIGLKTVQIMSGAITIMHYLGRIMEESKANISLEMVFIIFGVIRFVLGLISTVLVDRVGRRPLLFYSCLTYGLSLTSVGIYFFLQEIIRLDNETLRICGFVPFVGIIISNIVSSLGVASLIFIIPAEIFPMNVKALAMSGLNIYGGVMGFIVAIAYQNIKDVSGLTGVFWVFSGVSFAGAVFVYFTLPETKGKSLHEIQIEFQGPEYMGDGTESINDTRNNIDALDCDNKMEEVELKDRNRETDSV